MTQPLTPTLTEGLPGGELHVEPPLPLSRRDVFRARRAQVVRFIQFAIVGGLASIVYLGLSAILLMTGMHYLVAGAISYLAAIATNFTVNRQWTFDGGGLRSIHVQAVSFLVVQLTIGAMNLALLHVLVVTGVSPIILAQLLAAGVLFPVNFFASQRWGFR